jgi:translation initiation factor 2 subunit 3
LSKKTTSKKKDKKTTKKSSKKADSAAKKSASKNSKSSSKKSKAKTTGKKKSSKKTSSKEATTKKAATKKKETTSKKKTTSTSKKKPASKAKTGKSTKSTTSKKKSAAKKETKSSSTKSTKTTETKKKKSTAKKKEVEKTTEPVRKQAEVNIGTIGHVDHGKSTLVKALTGTFPDTHSEELKRGITIRLGYADTDIRYCPKCDEDKKWTTYETCPKCGEETKVRRRISFVDAPGHEVLMATLLTGAAIFDGAILVVAANEDCPQAQTREHLAAMNAVGIQNIIIVQNKVELVTEEEAEENYKQILKFVKGTVAEGAPIIPLSAVHGANIDLLIKTIEEVIKTPKRNEKVDPRMFVARSFEINKLGTKPEELLGGVLGGSIIQGVLKNGDDIEIRPGARVGKNYEPIKTNIESIFAGTVGEVDKAKPGGLMSIRTNIDPSLTRADNLVGNIIGLPDKLPPVLDEINMNINLMDFVVGLDKQEKVKNLVIGEQLMLNIWTAITLGQITDIGKGNIITVKLARPVCVETGTRVAISRRLSGRFRLIGFGIIE